MVFIEQIYIVQDIVILIDLLKNTCKPCQNVLQKLINSQVTYSGDCADWMEHVAHPVVQNVQQSGPSS